MNPIALRSLRPCDLCGSAVSGRTRDGNAMDFHRVVIEHHLLDMNALREHAVLSLMLAGSEALALAMGSQPNGTKPFAGRELFVCNPCWLEKLVGLVHADEAAQGKELLA